MHEFDYDLFRKKLFKSKDESKQQIISSYVKNYGWNPIDKEPFYEDYLIKFTTPIYNVPMELYNLFNWDLLAKLICGSFSSNYDFKFKKDSMWPNLVVKVSGNSQVVEKSIDELDESIRVARLYEIYLEEQMNLSNLIYEEENEKTVIVVEREYRVNLFKEINSKLEKEQVYKENLYKGRQAIRSIVDFGKDTPF